MASVYRRYYYHRNVLLVLINHYHNGVIYTYVFPRGFFSLLKEREIDFLRKRALYIRRKRYVERDRD